LPNPPSAPTPDLEVIVHLSASPPNAKLYLDDEMLDDNPYSKSIPVDPTPHKLRAEAPGYSSETAVITFAQNTDVSLTLERVQPPHAALSPRAPRAAPSASAPGAESEAKKAKPDCNPPYVIEESGIRRLKPECL
jgi:serine/threonine-protein kinase